MPEVHKDTKVSAWRSTVLTVAGAYLFLLISSYQTFCGKNRMAFRLIENSMDAPVCLTESPTKIEEPPDQPEESSHSSTWDKSLSTSDITFAIDRYG